MIESAPTRPPHFSSSGHRYHQLRLQWFLFLLQHPHCQLQPTCPNHWHHGSKRVPRTLRSKCNSSFCFCASPNNDVRPCHAIYFPYPHWFGPFCQTGLQYSLQQDICHSLPSQRPPYPQRLVGPGQHPALAIHSHCSSSNASSLATFGSNFCEAICHHVSFPASP
jgi:hypothetical protein